MAARDPLAYASPMRIRVVLSTILAVASPACFKELPTVPEGSEDTGAVGSTSTSDAPTEMSESSASSSGAAGTMIPSDSDVDMATTGVVPPPEEQLFACFVEFCDVWVPPNCAKGCELDGAGRCLLEQMRDRSTRRGDVRVCGDTCERTVLAIRGGGTDEVERQTATELGNGGLVDYQPHKKCLLREPEFFAGCLESLTPACVDMAQWFKSCGDTPLVCGGG